MIQVPGSTSVSSPPTPTGQGPPTFLSVLPHWCAQHLCQAGPFHVQLCYPHVDTKAWRLRCPGHMVWKWENWDFSKIMDSGSENSGLGSWWQRKDPPHHLGRKHQDVKLFLPQQVFGGHRARASWVWYKVASIIGKGSHTCQIFPVLFQSQERCYCLEGKPSPWPHSR